MISAEFVKQSAYKLGFSACGLCRAGRISDDWAEKIRKYVEEGRNGEMEYLARNMDLRMDARKLVPGTKTIVSVALNYYPAKKMDSDNSFTLSYHAYGKDYHEVVKQRLKLLFEIISENLSSQGITLEGRAFCDTAPVPERYWAWRAGVGFIGKSTLLIIPRKGSFFFLGELFLSDEADAYDEPLTNLCGSCTKCMDSCPGKALFEPFKIDARRCLSYLTIERRGPLPEGTAEKMGSGIYGCDVCQRVCPHNRFAEPTVVSEFAPSEKLLSMTREDWEGLTEEEFRSLFKGSSVKRAKYSGLKRNIDAVDRKNEENKRHQEN